MKKCFAALFVFAVVCAGVSAQDYYAVSYKNQKPERLMVVVLYPKNVIQLAYFADNVHQYTLTGKINKSKADFTSAYTAGEKKALKTSMDFKIENDVVFLSDSELKKLTDAKQIELINQYLP